MSLSLFRQKHVVSHAKCTLTPFRSSFFNHVQKPIPTKIFRNRQESLTLKSCTHFFFSDNFDDVYTHRCYAIAFLHEVNVSILVGKRLENSIREISLRLKSSITLRTLTRFRKILHDRTPCFPYGVINTVKPPWKWSNGFRWTIRRQNKLQLQSLSVIITFTNI